MKKFIYLLLASVIMMAACSREVSVGYTTFTVKTGLSGVDKWYSEKGGIVYDEISFLHEYSKAFYIGRIGNQQWVLNYRGKRIIEEPFLKYKVLGGSIREGLVINKHFYFRIETAKGSYLICEEGPYDIYVVGGPYEDIFKMEYSLYLYKQNGKWGAGNGQIKPEYDALIAVWHEVYYGESELYFLYRKGNTWGAVDPQGNPYRISQSQIKNFLAIKPNSTGYLYNYSPFERYRQRIGNDTVGYIEFSNGVY